MTESPNLVYPLLIKEVVHRDRFGKSPRSQIASNWAEIESIKWILALKLKRVYLSSDGKYILGENQTGHSRILARMYTVTK